MPSRKLDTNSGKVTCGKSEEIHQNSSLEDKVQYEFPIYNVLDVFEDI